jgi:hypothetical protein
VNMKLRLAGDFYQNQATSYDEQAVLATIPFEWRKYPKMVERALEIARVNAECNK